MARGRNFRAERGQREMFAHEGGQHECTAARLQSVRGPEPEILGGSVAEGVRTVVGGGPEALLGVERREVALEAGRARQDGDWGHRERVCGVHAVFGDAGWRICRSRSGGHGR